ncbi:MAG: amidohydrolase family protein [Phycisphaerales bacterium]|nr:MAG: amidohydrolase family protein [Phycisphaerales bacterium]UCF15368.1 MAG: amidohydrolase family protein [Phycisphaerales bacterium]
MIIDVNVTLSRWPFRRLPCDELPMLIEKLRGYGVTEAWAGNFDGVFHKDMGGVNARLVDDCRKSQPVLLRPFGSVNPKLPDWREDLRRCHEDYNMPGIRLHPAYHGYRLDDPVFAELLTQAQRRGLIVQLVVRIEDPRMQHPLMRVPDVDPKPLPRLLASHPELRLILLGALQTVRGEAITQLIHTGQVYLEISTLEGVGAVASLLGRVPGDRILFGSHCPFFTLESAVFKLQESELLPVRADAITHQNAQRLLKTQSASG